MSGAILGGDGQLSYPPPPGGNGGGFAIGELFVRDNTVGLWTLNGSLADTSGNNNTMVDSGGAPAEPFQQAYGRSWYYFQGGHYLSCGDPAVFDDLDSVSLSLTVFWIREVLGGEFPHLIGKMDFSSNVAADNTQYVAYVDGTANKFAAAHEWGTGTNQLIPMDFTRADAFIGQPMHICLRRDTSIKTYSWCINGREVDTKTYSTDPTSGADSPVCIGGSPGGANDSIGLLVCNARIDTEYLSDDDVLEDANFVMNGG